MRLQQHNQEGARQRLRKHNREGARRRLRKHNRGGVRKRFQQHNREGARQRLQQHNREGGSKATEEEARISEVGTRPGCWLSSPKLYISLDFYQLSIHSRTRRLVVKFERKHDSGSKVEYVKISVKFQVISRGQISQNLIFY